MTHAVVRTKSRALVLCLITFGPFTLLGCSGSEGEAEVVEFDVPAGASFGQVTDTLVAHELVRFPRAFRAFARLRGNDTAIRAGRYGVPAGVRWVPLLDQLVAGRVITVPLTIPEGFTLEQMASRLAQVTGLETEDVDAFLRAEGSDEIFGVAGPGLEGYLFPDTYFFAPGIPLEQVVRTMVQHHQAYWTEDRVARAEALGLSQQEVTTLASIVQAEARWEHEMGTISGVFHNRLRIGYLLQADPTVQYALSERQSRLLYADIDSVADHPYNTYTQPGLPPGPIGTPGAAALDAALSPEDVSFLYFVARPDGTHIFTSSLEEHNRARVQARREWDDLQRIAQQEDG
jgi:UPF0755 protein